MFAADTPVNHSDRRRREGGASGEASIGGRVGEDAVGEGKRVTTDSSDSKETSGWSVRKQGGCHNKLCSSDAISPLSPPTNRPQPAHLDTEINK